MPDLEGKVALVTGGSKGIGRAIAGALAGAGADIVLCSRNAEEAKQAAHDIQNSADTRALGIRCDVREIADVRDLIDTTVNEFGGLDILVANAGVGAFAPIDEIEPEDWAATIETNLSGVFYCCREAVPHLKKRDQGGWIITIGSLAGRYAIAGGTAYNASKFGLVGFTEALMLDVRNHGIRVSCVMPGTVDTYFNESVPTGETWKLAPADVARVVLQLLDHEARSLPSRVELRPSQPKKG